MEERRIKPSLFLEVSDFMKKLRNGHDGEKFEAEKEEERNHMQGLTKEEVQQRIEAGQVNTPVDSATKSLKEIIISNTFTYFNLIFLIIAILLILVGSFRDLTFLPIIIANTLIGIVQEIRSKQVLDKLSILNAPKAQVVRDGKRQVIDATGLVKDDLVIFEAGNQIPADAVVVKGEANVNEALLTGEADEIVKTAGDELLSGSFIVSGKCAATLTKVGRESYISQLTLQATQGKEGEQSEMIRSLDKLVKVVGVAIIPIGILLFSQQYFYAGATFRNSVTSMVAAILGMIPEGLYLLASVALAVSVMRLAKDKVLVHDMKCIETLARVNVLCVDKTGTITENTMKVQEFIPISTETGNRELPFLLGDFVQAMSSDNITMTAMKEAFTRNSGQKASTVFSFSSAYKYSGAVFGEEQLVLGAPEFILRDAYSQYAAQIEGYGAQGYRVLVFARYLGKLEGGALTAPVEALGFVLLSNPVRKGAKDTFRYFAKQGVEVKVISGDNPVTVSEVAKQAGIAHAERYVDATTLSTKMDYQDAVKNYTVFGRVTPNQKRELVWALKDAGKTVAMTGDGVNDVLALKDADCSVAMASGSEAAAQVAQLVLLESDFSKMPAVVLEGRRVVNNIQRSASLFLVKNIFSLLLSLFSVFFMLDYPLEPSQISLISMFTIGIPSFILALEPNKNMIKGHFLTNVLLKSLPAGLTDFFVVLGLVLFCREFNITGQDVSTCCTILLAIVGFMILHTIASPMTKMHWALIICMIGGWLFCMIFVSHLFAITGITKQCGMLLVIFAIITEPVLRYLSLLVRKLRGLYLKYRATQKRKMQAR